MPSSPISLRSLSKPDAGSDDCFRFQSTALIIDVGTALPEESYANLVDRVTAVGTAFMGLTVQCASCHDHKFDMPPKILPVICLLQ